MSDDDDVVGTLVCNYRFNRKSPFMHTQTMPTSTATAATWHRHHRRLRHHHRHTPSASTPLSMSSKNNLSVPNVPGAAGYCRWNPSRKQTRTSRWRTRHSREAHNRRCLFFFANTPLVNPRHRRRRRWHLHRNWSDDRQGRRQQRRSHLKYVFDTHIDRQQTVLSSHLVPSRTYYYAMPNIQQCSTRTRTHTHLTLTTRQIKSTYGPGRERATERSHSICCWWLVVGGWWPLRGALPGINLMFCLPHFRPRQRDMRRQCACEFNACSVVVWQHA